MFSAVASLLTSSAATVDGEEKVDRKYSAEALQSEVVSSRHWLSLIRIAALLAVFMSVALLQHYLAPQDSAFCGPASGCESVRKSAPNLFGIPYFIPAVGVAAYVGLFWLSFFPRVRHVLQLASIAGALIGCGLLVHQALAIGAFCWMCVMVDLLAMVIGGFALASWRSDVAQLEPLRGWAWAALLALSLYAPSLWSMVEPESPLPPAIAELQRPGALNVIEFIDIQCPHCRRLHPVLKAEMQRMSGSIVLQRYHKPLSFHPLAEPAARAGICGSTLGRGEQLTDLLLENPLTDGVWLEHARTLGIDASEFERCLTSERTTATLKEHAAVYAATGARGLPMTFIGSERIKGAPDPVFIVRAFDAATAPQQFRIPGWAFALGCVAAAALVGVVGYRRKSSRPAV